MTPNQPARVTLAPPAGEAATLLAMCAYAMDRRLAEARAEAGDVQIGSDDAALLTAWQQVERRVRSGVGEAGRR